MKVVFEGSYAEFRAVFGSSGGGKSSEEAALAEPSSPTPVAEPNTPHTVGASTLPVISQEKRDNAWAMFVDTCKQWVIGFEEKDVPQPDRLKLLQDIGSGPWPIPILVMAYEMGSLQRMVEKALTACGFEYTWRMSHQSVAGVDNDWLDYVNRVAATMIQICHMGFPDLAGTYDHSLQWRK
jgi:hypothetical protein